MSELVEMLSGICPAGTDAGLAAERRWDEIAKPLGGLGLLERAVVRMAAMTGTPDVDISRRAVVVMCADNGVVAEGVSQTGQEVTAVVTENLSAGRSSVCRMAEVAGADVVPVDIGVARPVEGGRILQRNIRRGTGNIAKGPAMSREEAVRAVRTGAAIARELKEAGYTLLATGEMGIGNTTTSAAVAAVLLGLEPEITVGRGAGLSAAGLARKRLAVRRAIACNRPDPSDPVDVLAKVGGLDLAGLAGVFLGGALCRLPVLVDGVISAVAALAAVRMCPAAGDYLLASHASAEPAGDLVLRELGLSPLIRAGMRLGEGTGAVAAIPLLDMALAVYREMPTFEETHIEAYQPLE